MESSVITDVDQDNNVLYLIPIFSDVEIKKYMYVLTRGESIV